MKNHEESTKNYACFRCVQATTSPASWFLFCLRSRGRHREAALGKPRRKARCHVMKGCHERENLPVRVGVTIDM